MTKWMLALWFGCCLAGILVMSVSQLVDYDPKLKLSAAIGDTSFERDLTRELRQDYSDLTQSVVHFSSSACFCTTLAASHITRLSDSMAKKGFANIHVNINQVPQLARYVPSIPSVAIFGKEQELVYLGPYSEGYGCLNGTGLVDAVLPKALSQEIENALLITEAKGCYCPT